MKPPTPRELDLWRRSLGISNTDPVTCTQRLPDGSVCGYVGPACYVQPTHLFWGGGATCPDCHNRQYHERRAARKAELALEARCEASGCKRRGTKIVGSTLLCGTHLKTANRNRYKNAGALAGMLLFAPAPTNRETILALAEQKP